VRSILGLPVTVSLAVALLCAPARAEDALAAPTHGSAAGGGERATATRSAPREPSAPAEPGALDAIEVSGWVLFGLGSASFVAGVATGILAIQQGQQLDAGCPESRCPPEYHARVDAFAAYRTTSTATLAAAGALGIAGIALLLAARAESPTEGVSARAVHLVIRPSALAIVGAF
jgi:hypothetical protein